MSYLNAGTLLRIDLTTGKITRQPTSDYADLWLGGRGLNARILYEELTPDTDPLGPENVLMFSVGPLTGTMVPGSGRTEIAAKSPVIPGLGMSNMGGFFGPELKYAGYDSLLVTGRASSPVYIAIDNDDVQIKDARHLWGVDTYDTPAAIRKELGDPDVEVACIGPAGENQVIYATIQNRIGNAAGRTGMGAVMGSKNLKAVAIRGTRGVRIADPEKFMQLCQEAFEVQKPLLEMAVTISAVGNEPNSWAEVLGNYEATEWAAQKQLKGGHIPFWEKHKNRVGDGKIGCFNCQVRCSDYYDVAGIGPLASSCNVYASSVWVVKDPDLMSWYKMAALCQREGLDIMSASRMLAWAMGLREEGRLDSRDTDGIALEWGNSEAMLQMLAKMSRREGFGEVLVSRVDEAAAKIGPDVEPPLHVKGNPAGGTNIMNWRSRALGTAISPRGGDEYRARYGSFDYLGSGKGSGMTGMASPDSWEAKTALEIVKGTLGEHKGEGGKTEITQFDYEARGKLAAMAQKLVNVSDMLGQCRWNTIFLNVGVSVEFQADAFSAGTGHKTSIDDLLEAGLRLANQEKASQLREGWTREHDNLPKKLFNHRMPGTWPQDELDPEKFEQMKDEYYASMGWDAVTGLPIAETLGDLKLSDVAADLKKLNKLAG